MSIRKQPEPAKGGKRLSWKANLLFAAVVLAAAALLFWLLRPRSKAEPLEAVVDFGDGITEVLPLDKDYDYLYEVGGYVVQNALYLKGTACLFGPVEHPEVCFAAGDPAGIQQLPFLTAEGQGKDFVLHLVVPEQIDQILVRVEIHHDAAEIEYDIFIHPLSLLKS